MSKRKTKKRRSETLSEQKTLPIQSPDIHSSKTNAAQQNQRNVIRTKKWSEENEL